MCPSVGASPTFRQKARCVHKGWIQAIFLGHQLRQVFLLFHSADFAPAPGEAQGAARSDAGSPGSAGLPRGSASAAARGPPRVLTGPCGARLRLPPSGCAAPRPGGRSLPSSLTRAGPRLPPAALTGEAGPACVPPPPSPHC